MIDFINEALNRLTINQNCLLPIYIDRQITINHYLKFSSELLRNLEDYYLSKYKYCLGSTTPYRYFIRMKDKEKPPVICNLDYDNFLFYIEFSNIETERCILIGINKTTSHLSIIFYSNYVHGNKNDKVKTKGGVYLVSNMFNNGISTPLLNMFYRFMENDDFDIEAPFQPITYI